MDCYIPVKSKKLISEILSALVGTQITMEISDNGFGVAIVKLGHKFYRLTYHECFEREDGTTHGLLAQIEEIKTRNLNPWRNSSLVH